MRISVVNLTSDSSDNEDSERDVVSRSKNTCAKSSQKFGCESEQATVKQRVPLFKIMFKDVRTSRIYRKRLEDIIKYLLAANLDEDSECNSEDLVLEIYDSAENLNATITTDSKIEQSGFSVICNDNKNHTVNFNFDEEMKIDSVVKDGSNNQNCDVLPVNAFDQINQTANIFGEFNWGILQCTQPQASLQYIVQSDYSPTVDFSIKKRKWVDDADEPSPTKKKRVECASGSLMQVDSQSNELENSQKNPSKTLYYDPVWWSEPQNTATESMSLEKVKDPPREPFIQAQVANSSLTNQNASTTFTYRVLKVGTFDYTKKRNFSISKNGIELNAHHLSESYTLVKVHIAIANIVKIEASFSQILPALIIYVNKEGARIVKEALGINNDFMAALDPLSTDDNCNKIIILPDQLPENCRILKNLIKVGLVKKLDKESADVILLNSFSKILEIRQFANGQILNIKSHTVRLGTYKCSNMRFNVMVSVKGFQFQVPKVGDDQIYKKIIMDFTEIEKLYFCLKKVNAFFIHVNSSCAQRIRSLIEMPDASDTSAVYFDPNSEIMSEQRLVIIFNKIKQSQQETLRNFLSLIKAAEISLDKIVHQMLFNHM